jgi:hypothetical protein
MDTERECRVAGCAKSQRTCGYCAAHYMEHRRRERGVKPRQKGRRACAFPGCGRPNFGHGLCSAHYMQKRRGVELRAVRQPRPDDAPGYRWCSRCKQFVDETRFGWDTVRDQPQRVCVECHAAGSRLHRAKNRESINLRVRLKRRGISKVDYDEMLATQSGRCGICRKDRPLDIDHCHKKGNVRALLCGPCNRALGFFEDDPAVVRAALVFLEAHTT